MKKQFQFSTPLLLLIVITFILMTPLSSLLNLLIQQYAKTHIPGRNSSGFSIVLFMTSFDWIVLYCFYQIYQYKKKNISRALLIHDLLMYGFYLFILTLIMLLFIIMHIPYFL